MMTSEGVLSDFSSMRSAVAGTACTLNTLEPNLDEPWSERETNRISMNDRGEPHCSFRELDAVRCYHRLQ